MSGIARRGSPAGIGCSATREWGEIARELLHGAGVAERDDPGGPRWVAIRHADDHIHIAVVLVRQDTGRRFWPYRDYPRLRETARELERRLGLTVTAAADGTAERAPTRGEREKAARQGRRPARVELVRAIRRAAITAHDVASFEAALQEGGYRIEIRRAPSGDPLGYKVARPADLTATGEPIFYSGSKLAADLSLPRLLRRWAESPDRGCAGWGRTGDRGRCCGRARPPARRRQRPAAVVVARVRSRRSCMRAPMSWRRSGGPVGSRPRWRSTARPGPRMVEFGSSSPLSIELRRVARRLVRRRTPVGADEISAGAALAVALVALAWEIAAWRRRRAQPHQAAAADVAAGVLAAWSARLPSPDAVRTLRPRPGLGPDTLRARVDPSGR